MSLVITKIYVLCLTQDSLTFNKVYQVYSYILAVFNHILLILLRYRGPYKEQFCFDVKGIEKSGRF